MSENANETIADIVAEMRKVNCFSVPYAPSGHNGVWSADLLEFADRLDAAWKREHSPAPKSSAPTTFVNAAALREVLVSISSIDTRSLNRLLYELVENDIPDGGLINKIIANVNKAKAALAEPPDPIGNNAKMREALVWLQKTGQRTPEGGWMCITLKMTQKDGMPYPIEVPPYAEDVINAALAAPPRNCDVFGSEDEAKSAFIAYYNEAYALKGSNYEIDTCDLKHDVDGILHDYIKWLFASAKSETTGEDDGSK